jgi:hypothetical protein
LPSSTPTIETLNGKHYQIVNEVKKLDGPIPVVAPQKPSVAFGNNKRGSDNIQHKDTKAPRKGARLR